MLPLFLALGALVLFRWDYRLHWPTDGCSLSLVGLGAVLTVLAAYRNSPWFSAVGFACLATGWLRSHWQAEPAGLRLTYLALLLLMLIRLPLNLDLSLAGWLQRITSRASSLVLDALGVTHYLRGNVLELPGGTLFVEEACSGVQSLFTVLFLVCLWIVWRRRPLMATPAYLLAGVVWAMVMNIVRITSIALAQEWYATDLSKGTPHEILGWVCLSTAVLMMLSTDRLLRVVFYPVPPDESGQLGNPFSRLWNHALLLSLPEREGDEDLPPDVVDRPVTACPPGFFRHRPPATAMLVLAVLVCLPSLALGYQVVTARFATPMVERDRPLLWEPEPQLIRLAGFAEQVTDHQSLRNANSKQLGNHADVWTLVVGGTPVRIAVSQPYPEWHDMRLCYSGNGWQVNHWESALESPPPARGDSDPSRPGDAAEASIDRWPVSHSELVRETGEFGTLLFCGVTRDGRPLTPPMSGLYNLLGERVKDRDALQSNVIMLQLWTVTRKPLMPEQFQDLRRVFDSFRSVVLDRLPKSADPQSLEKRVASFNAGGESQ
jgi:exosortase